MLISCHDQLFIVISAKSTNFTTNTRYHVESSVDEPLRLQQQVLFSWSLEVLMSSSSRSPGSPSSPTCPAPSSCNDNIVSRKCSKDRIISDDTFFCWLLECDHWQLAKSRHKVCPQWRTVMFNVLPYRCIRCFRAWFYCKSCHESVRDENQIKKCKCKNCK